MERKFSDINQTDLVPKDSNQKRLRKIIRIVLLCIIMFISGFLFGTYNKADAAVFVRNAKDIVSANKEPQKIEQSGSTKTSVAASSTPKNAGGVSESKKLGSSFKDKWPLILVNPWSKIPNGYKVTLQQLINGQAVDEHCYPDLQKMMDDCRAAGLSPYICSSYRSQGKQEELFNQEVRSYTAIGYSQENAKTEAAKSVAVPGTSEHQLGLALDIVDANNQNLDTSQEKTDVQRWMMANSWKYGFILRYPSNKSSITGIIYEPWHYRYVGKEAAKKIHDQGICLEEYLNQK